MEQTAETKKLYQNNIIETIYTRRAVRKFNDKPVDKLLIEELVDAGRMAPSAVNKQPWHFYILTKKEDIEVFEKETSTAAAKGILSSGIKNIVKSVSDAIHLSHGLDFLKAQNPIFHGAPVVIFITAAKDNEWASLDVGMCSQNIMLAAKSLGLESCPVGLGKFVESTGSYPKLNIPTNEHVLLAILIGYSDEKPVLHERIKDNIHFIE